MRGTLGIFYSSKKRKNEENSGRARSVINSGDAEVNKIINRTSRHFISLSFYYNTYQNMSHHKKCNVQPAVMSISYAANILNELCPWPGSVNDACGVRDIGRVTQLSRSVSVNI